MRNPGPGLRYAPLPSAKEFPATEGVSFLGSNPAPSEPGTPFPEVSGTTLGTPPVLYPSDGPTEFAWLYGEMQRIPFAGVANTWTQPQSFGATAPANGVTQFVLTDTGGGADSDLLRPDTLTVEHLTTQPTVAGVGTGIGQYVKDAGGTRLRIARDIAEITTTTAGAVDSTRAFCVRKAGEEIEVARLRGATGQAAYTPVGGTTGASGKAGGELLAWGSLYHFGNTAGFFGTTPVAKPTLAAAATDAASTQTLANSLRTALIALGLGA